MGNHISGHSKENVFEKELFKLNQIVSDIIDSNDIFKNKYYNFLSEDICQEYQVVLEEELSKHLKLDIKTLGASLYIIPKSEDSTDKLTKFNLTKQEICNKISNHYIKILYILCLVKYVYNLEKHGDLSIIGIIFRNIKIIDDMMQIHFCSLPHKKYSENTFKIDFGQLEGLKFFTEFFLTPKESSEFIGLLRAILARSNPQKINNLICDFKSDFNKLEEMYNSHYNKKLKCQRGGNLHLYVEKDNPIFLSEYCAASIKIVIKLNTEKGKKIYEFYKQMHANYQSNIASIQKILDKLVVKSNNQFELRDITKKDLDNLIQETKSIIKLFYYKSILDFQKLLDMAKDAPNIHISK
jgi:hypothetical protein